MFFRLPKLSPEKLQKHMFCYCRRIIFAFQLKISKICLCVWTVSHTFLEYLRNRYSIITTFLNLQTVKITLNFFFGFSMWITYRYLNLQMLLSGKWSNLFIKICLYGKHLNLGNISRHLQFCLHRLLLESNFRSLS